VTSVFFITNRPLGAQFILDECIALKATIQARSELLGLENTQRFWLGRQHRMSYG
jgi:hypothetical protein